MTDFFSNQQQPNPYANQNPYNPNPYSSPTPAQNPYSSPVPAQNPYSSPIPAQSQSSPYSNPTPTQNPPSSPFQTPSYQQQSQFPDASTFSSSYYGGQPAKSKTPIILIVVAVLLFAVGGVFAGLYVSASGDHDTASSALEDKKAQLADIKDDITTAKGDKTKAEDHNGDVESQNSELQPCVDATQTFLWDTPATASDAEISAAVQAMRDACA